VRSLGRVAYREATDLQHAIAVSAEDDYLLVLEHPHVYTLGRHANPSHMLVDPASVGAEVIRTDRGGDVTYHGPGQLVLYPVVTVTDHPSAGPAHVGRLEQVVIEALATVAPGLHAGRIDGYPGVWLGRETDAPRKVAAVGVRTLRGPDGRRRTLHGLALNVSCDLTMFEHIVPCGIRDKHVTSLHAEGATAPMAEVARAVVDRAVAAFGGGIADQQGNGMVDHAGVTGWPARRERHASAGPEQKLPLGARKPPWLRVPVHMGEGFLGLGRTVRDLDLVTVCEEAGCPNIYECWSDGTATFMINGSRCTRACRFCLVDTQRPLPLDPTEPGRVAEAVDRLGLAHAVITCVARDDLPDGGAGALATTVTEIRRRRPDTRIELLISDCKGDPEALDTVLDARPDVLNHNIETVARLQRAIRPSAGYARSLAVLARAASAGLTVKSGLMVGLGESEEEVVSTLADLRSVGVSIATIGQYLRPSAAHWPVARWWSPDEMARLGQAGRELGIGHVESTPLTRSSYHARHAADAVVPAPLQLARRERALT